MPHTIPPARPDEADVIATLHEASARAAYAHIFPPEQPFPSEETRQRWRSFGGQIIVAEEEGHVVGFVAFDATELHALYVLPTCWGQGLGQRLLAAAEAIRPVCHLWVLRDNARARRFYERHGREPDGTEQAPFGVVELGYRRRPSR